MRIRDVLAAKSPGVLTVTPGTPVPGLLSALAARGVGAAVVVDDDGAVVGMASERDVVRHLHHRGADLLGADVGSIMTGPVTTCRPDDEVEDLGAIMTSRRIRHLPVVEPDDELGTERLTGIVSIGDVVKTRLDELESHRSQLEAYISG